MFRSVYEFIYDLFFISPTRGVIKYSKKEIKKSKSREKGGPSYVNCRCQLQPVVANGRRLKE